MLILLGVATSESTKPRPCFSPLLHYLCSLFHLLPCFVYLFKFISLHFATHITRILPSLRRTSAPIQLIVVLGVLGTQETFCILIAGLLKKDHLQHLFP